MAGMVYSKQKLTTIKEVYSANAGVNVWQTIGFTRYQTNPASVPNVETFDRTDRWQNSGLARVWKEYMITGMAVKWMPTNMVGSSGTGTIQNIWEWDEVKTQANAGQGVTNGAIMQNATFKQLPTADRGWSFYRAGKPYAAQEKSLWQDCTSYNAATANSLPDATTYVRFLHTDMPLGTRLGYFKITWYVTLRGQKDP